MLPPCPVLDVCTVAFIDPVLPLLLALSRDERHLNRLAPAVPVVSEIASSHPRPPTRAAYEKSGCDKQIRAYLLGPSSHGAFHFYKTLISDQSQC